MDKTLYTLIVHSENIAGLLNQITAVFTRRQINIESLNVSASSIKGVHKYTITAWTTQDVIEKVVKQIEKKIDVLQAHYFTDSEIYQHEIALYKVSTPEFQENPMASKVIRRYSARIVEVNPVFSIVEKNGMSEEITALYEELRGLGCVLQFVRSGRVAITTTTVAVVATMLRTAVVTAMLRTAAIATLLRTTIVTTLLTWLIATS